MHLRAGKAAAEAAPQNPMHGAAVISQRDATCIWCVVCGNNPHGAEEHRPLLWNTFRINEMEFPSFSNGAIHLKLISCFSHRKSRPSAL